MGGEAVGVRGKGGRCEAARTRFLAALQALAGNRKPPRGGASPGGTYDALTLKQEPMVASLNGDHRHVVADLASGRQGLERHLQVALLHREALQHARQVAAHHALSGLLIRKRKHLKNKGA